jgi:hypothetical protein
MKGWTYDASSEYGHYASAYHMALMLDVMDEAAAILERVTPDDRYDMATVARAWLRKYRGEAGSAES